MVSGEAPREAAPTGRQNAECGQCLEVRRLVMPVRQECLGEPFTEWLCLDCRMTYDRADARRWYQGRVEGRLGLGLAGTRRLYHAE